MLIALTFIIIKLNYAPLIQFEKSDKVTYRNNKIKNGQLDVKSIE